MLPTWLGDSPSCRTPAPPAAAADLDSADTGKGRADTGQLQSELVHSPAIAWARIGVVLRSGPELDRAKKVGVGRAADIADVRARGWLEVCVDAVAAHVQAGVFSGLVVVHEVHMAEEPVMLASSDQAEVRVIAVVRDDEPAAGGEVARKCLDARAGRRLGIVRPRGSGSAREHNIIIVRRYLAEVKQGFA